MNWKIDENKINLSISNFCRCYRIFFEPTKLIFVLKWTDFGQVVVYRIFFGRVGGWITNGKNVIKQIAALLYSTSSPLNGGSHTMRFHCGWWSISNHCWPFIGTTAIERTIGFLCKAVWCVNSCKATETIRFSPLN